MLQNLWIAKILFTCNILEQLRFSRKTKSHHRNLVFLHHAASEEGPRNCGLGRKILISIKMLLLLDRLHLRNIGEISGKVEEPARETGGMKSSSCWLLNPGTCLQQFSSLKFPAMEGNLRVSRLSRPTNFLPMSMLILWPTCTWILTLKVIPEAIYIHVCIIETSASYLRLCVILKKGRCKVKLAKESVTTFSNNKTVFRCD